MKQYLDLLHHIRNNGTFKGDRTGTGTYSVFGHQMRFKLTNGFPLLTTKKLHLKSIIHELLWFLSGDTNVKYLQDHGVSIWNDWCAKTDTYQTVELDLGGRIQLYATEIGESLTSVTNRLRTMGMEGSIRFLNERNVPKTRQVLHRREGDLGPVYGHQWRNYGATRNPDGSYLPDGVDQIQVLIDALKNNPNSRRHIVTGWNPKEVDEVALPPCHTLFQFWIRDLTADEIRRYNSNIDSSFSWDGNGKFEDLTDKHKWQYIDELNEIMPFPLKMKALSCQLYQRSADVFLGVPFNIASYALLTMMIAQVCNMVADEFIWTGGDCHLYTNHLEQADLQLTREPLESPTMTLNPSVKSIFDFTFNDFILADYQPHPAIKAPVAV